MNQITKFQPEVLTTNDLETLTNVWKDCKTKTIETTGHTKIWSDTPVLLMKSAKFGQETVFGRTFFIEKDANGTIVKVDFKPKSFAVNDPEVSKQPFFKLDELDPEIALKIVHLHFDKAVKIPHWENWSQNEPAEVEAYRQKIADLEVKIINDHNLNYTPKGHEFLKIHAQEVAAILANKTEKSTGRGR